MQKTLTKMPSSWPLPEMDEPSCELSASSCARGGRGEWGTGCTSVSVAGVAAHGAVPDGGLSSRSAPQLGLALRGPGSACAATRAQGTPEGTSPLALPVPASLDPPPRRAPLMIFGALAAVAGPVCGRAGSCASPLRPGCGSPAWHAASCRPAAERLLGERVSERGPRDELSTPPR